MTLYLYKIISPENWKESQSQNCVKLAKEDDEFIHLATESQLQKIIDKYWGNASAYVILKVAVNRLPGELVYEANPGGTNKYYHLYGGAIPRDSIVEFKIK